MRKCENVAELCDFLTSLIYGNLDSNYKDMMDYYDEDDLIAINNEYDKYKQELNEKREKFRKNVETGVKDLNGLKKIIFYRNFSASGEGNNALENRDSELILYAQKVLNSEGDKKEKAKKEMLEYIKNANISEYCYNFGRNFKIVKYNWNDSEDVENLAKRLISDHCQAYESGVEYSEYDVETDKFTEEARYNL